MQVLLRQNDRGSNSPAPQPNDDAQPTAQEEKPIICRRCAQKVSDLSALFCMDSDNVCRIFPNPYGLLREILTALYAVGLHIEGPATTEFTWFPGYAWEIVYCETCNTHLGWRYAAVHADVEPQTFYGLLREAVKEG